MAPGPAQVNTAPINTRGDDGSPQQRCDAAAGREQRDNSGGRRAQLFLFVDRLLRLIRLEKITTKIFFYIYINSVHLLFFLSFVELTIVCVSFSHYLLFLFLHEHKVLYDYFNVHVQIVIDIDYILCVCIIPLCNTFKNRLLYLNVDKINAAFNSNFSACCRPNITD